MPTIQIEDEAWERLKAWAVPLEDTADDVLRRILDAAEGRTAKPRKRRATNGRAAAPKKRKGGNKLPQKEFRVPLMEAIYEAGGSATKKELRDIMAKRMKRRLGDADYRLTANGEARWWSALVSERNELVKKGLFQRKSPRGVWRLSKEGSKFIESARGDGAKATK
ncbi:MAG: hypothetical protein MJE12_22395 [Alphaproteobacteria bacterium]|nr:hypothetical protein [Alphaproteobacteria bacterium]